MHSYSKGARGLSVQPQEFRIFTENSISLSSYWRQQDSRYAIHAGHQLNAKEFRYLRTVRVTAAVYRRLQKKLKPTFSFSHAGTGQASASILLFTNLQRPVFLLNSRCPRFCANLNRLPRLSHSFSRSYGVILPSSFNMILSNVLIYSICPPVLV